MKLLTVCALLCVMIALFIAADEGGSDEGKGSTQPGEVDVEKRTLCHCRRRGGCSKSGRWVGWIRYGRRGGWNKNGRRVGWMRYGRRGGWTKYGRRGGWNKNGRRVGWIRYGRRQGWTKCGKRVGRTKSGRRVGWIRYGRWGGWNRYGRRGGWTKCGKWGCWTKYGRRVGWIRNGRQVGWTKCGKWGCWTKYGRRVGWMRNGRWGGWTKYGRRVGWIRNGRWGGWTKYGRWVGWIRYDNRYYRYFPYRWTWAQAQRFCESKNANLASVRNLGEYRTIQRVIYRATHRSDPTWIGGSDARQEHHWFWVDGTPFRYTNWCHGEPNNVCRSEHCLHMNWTGCKCMNDVPCNYRYPFVCMRKRR